MIKNSWELTSTGKIEIPSFEFVLDSVCMSPVGSFEGDCKFAKKRLCKNLALVIVLRRSLIDS